MFKAKKEVSLDDVSGVFLGGVTGISSVILRGVDGIGSVILADIEIGYC